MMLRSCYCCDLRGGAMAVSIVFLSLSVLELLAVLIGWGHADAYRAYYSRRYVDSEASAILAPLTVFVPVQLSIDALLLHGVLRWPTLPSSSRRDVSCWLVFRAAQFGLVSLGSFALLVSAVIMRYTGSERESVMYGAAFVMAAIVSGLFWYAWIVVLSFYWHLRDCERGSAPVAPNTVQLETTSAETRPGAAGQPATPVEASAPLMGGDGRHRDQNRCQKCTCSA